MKKLLVFSILCAYSGIQAKEITTQTPKQNAIPQITSKQLRSLELDILNSVWEKKPFETLRLNVSIKTLKQFLLSSSVHKTLNPTPEQDTEFLAQYLPKFIELENDFFTAIQKHAGSLRPLVAESLTSYIPENESILLKYFELKVPDPVEFCSQEITTVEQFDNYCIELLYLFHDFRASLSPEAKQAYKDLLNKIKAKKQSQSS